MNLFSFALIVAVDVAIKNELLTYALIIWGSLLFVRFALRQYRKSQEYTPGHGRNY